jgi:protein gp37
MLGRNLPSHSGPEPTFHPDRLDVPLHWRKPRRIFVCSMSDLFHEAFTDEQRDAVFATIDRCPQHTFMVLTKRAEAMHEYVDRLSQRMLAFERANWAAPITGEYAADRPLPMNVWIGVTAENQQRADERIPILLETPAAVRFLSVEPMLGEVDLSRYLGVEWMDALDGYGHEMFAALNGQVGKLLSWVILGGETGPGARPMEPAWALDVYRQCQAAGVPFFWKRPGDYWGKEVGRAWAGDEGLAMMQTREFPEVAS